MRFSILLLLIFSPFLHAQWRYGGDFDADVLTTHSFNVTVSNPENMNGSLWRTVDGSFFQRIFAFDTSGSHTFSATSTRQRLLFSGLPDGTELPVDVSGSVRYLLTNSFSTTFNSNHVTADSGTLIYNLTGNGLKQSGSTNILSVSSGSTQITLTPFVDVIIEGDLAPSGNEPEPVSDLPIVTLLNLAIPEFISPEGSPSPPIAFFHQPEGSSLDSAVEGSVNYDDLFGVSNPRISLNLPDLAVGDTVHFAVDQSGLLETGVIRADAAGNLLWVPEGTEIVSTTVTPSPVTGSPDPVVPPDPTSDPPPINTTGNNTTTNIITRTTNENNSVTINQSSIDNSVTNSSNTNIEVTGDGESLSTLSAAEETAGATAALLAGVASGEAEGEETYGERTREVSSSLAEAGEKLSGVTDQLELRLREFDPLPDGSSLGRPNSMRISLPLGPNDVVFDLDLDHPAVQLIRSVEFFVVGLFAVRFFFRILVV